MPGTLFSDMETSFSRTERKKAISFLEWLRVKMKNGMMITSGLEQAAFMTADSSRKILLQQKWCERQIFHTPLCIHALLNTRWLCVRKQRRNGE